MQTWQPMATLVQRWVGTSCRPQATVNAPRRRRAAHPIPVTAHHHTPSAHERIRNLSTDPRLAPADLGMAGVGMADLGMADLGMAGVGMADLGELCFFERIVHHVPQSLSCVNAWPPGSRVAWCHQACTAPSTTRGLTSLIKIQHNIKKKYACTKHQRPICPA